MSASFDIAGSAAAEAYLFYSCNGYFEFKTVEDDMHQLNDFCVAFLDAAQARVDMLETEASHGKGSVFCVDEKWRK